jgi:aminoglycoside phosphotransferase family enzyme/predicted kinase
MTDLSAKVVTLLADPASYPDPNQQIETIETHISWVFRSELYVYKLKKPVHFEFLDFSSPDARKAACEEEVRLNRRLSHAVYLGVVPITQEEPGRLKVNGTGPEVDYVVKMRRLPDNRAMDRLIIRHELKTSEVNAVAEYLIDFYAQLQPVKRQPDDYCRHLLNHCLANREDLLRHLGRTYEPQVRRIHSAQLLYLAVEHESLYARVSAGRVVDGHGDLRAEHIYLESPPSVIDCVEFSADLREVDVLDELCFLAMDCQRLGSGEVGRQLLATYAEKIGDRPADSLVAFYMSYRACVRAKVAALRAEQTGTPEKKKFLRQARQYLSWADYYAHRLPRPVLLTVGGLMGSGKSTLAGELAHVLGAELLSTDQLRKRMFGNSRTPATYGAGIYRKASRRAVYDQLFAKAAEILDSGCSVVLDGTFLTNDLRYAAVQCGLQHGACPLVVECECPRVVALERIRRRADSGGGDSEARPELYDLQETEHETLTAELPTVRVPTTRPLPEQSAQVCRAIRDAVHRTE